MNEDREVFLKKLESKKRDFQEAIGRLMENRREFNERLASENLRDESDQAQLEISVSGNYRLLERKTRELKNIDLLIRKIMKNDLFGVCEECGQPIPAERLLIVPEAGLCVPCQRELEAFDNRKKLSSGAAYSYMGTGAMEWRIEESEDSNGLSIDPGFDLLPSFEDEGDE